MGVGNIIVPTFFEGGTPSSFPILFARFAKRSAEMGISSFTFKGVREIYLRLERAGVGGRV
jgi:hypothetical protein